MKVALVGGTGFVGSYLIDSLLNAAHQLVVLVRPGSEDKLHRASECEAVTGDIGDDEALRKLVANVDAAIYNVGILRESGDISFEATQREGACRLVKHASDAGVGRFLLMSANGVIADGVPYQRTKWLAEQCALESDMQVTVFRPSVIFGDPQGRMEIATQLKQDMVAPPIPAVNFMTAFGQHRGPVTMSPVHVQDVADAFVAALDAPTTVGQIIEIGGPEDLTWGEMIRRVAAATGKRKLLLPMPIEVMSIAAFFLDWLPLFPVTRDQLSMLSQGNTASSAALADLIGRSPTAFGGDNLSYLSGR